MTPACSTYSWRPTACLRVSGPDAFEFLQGQFSNDLRELEHRPAVYGLWLSAKGKVVADSFILRGSAPQEFYVVSYFSSAASIRERLERYLIADDVTLADETAEWWGHTVVGPRSSSAPLPAGERLVFPGRRGFKEHLEWLARTPLEFPAARVLTVEEVARTRLEAGIPAVPVDIGPGELPQEGGLDAEAISYTKGCYLGQEVMARMKTMGQARRKLFPVAGAGHPPANPAPLYQGEKKVGELRSMAALADQGFVGLALITLLQLDPAAGFSLAPNEPSRLQRVEKR